jgi:hypothetical protein
LVAIAIVGPPNRQTIKAVVSGGLPDACTTPEAAALVSTPP